MVQLYYYWCGGGGGGGLVQLYCGTVVLVLGGELKVVFWQGFESLRLCCWWGVLVGLVLVFYW